MSITIEQAFAMALRLQQAGQHTQAAATYERIIAINPQFASAINNLGLLRTDMGQPEAALLLFRLALTLAPDSANAWCNVGSHWLTAGRQAEAAQAYDRSVRLNPLQPVLLNRLGLLLEALKQPEDAQDAFARAEKAAPLEAEYANNHGAMLRMAGQPLKASRHFGAHWNESLVRLLLGDFVEGWRRYEWRWKHGHLPSPQRAFTQPRWNGSPLKGRRLLVYWEQGYGDVLQFVRYAPLIPRDAQDPPILLECQRDLAPILRSLPGVSVIATGDPLPDFDLQVPVLSLPLLFGTRLETIPSRVPYLRAEPDAVARWRDRLSGLPGLKVGIVWAGSPTHGNDRNRSIGLAPFVRLAAIPGVSLVSIQKGPTEGQAANPPGSFPLLNLSPDIRDFADTAAIMTSLDLVVCVDTSVAHLAGALGVPVWVLVPFMPDWRWLLDRADSPWYPTMRLFRQAQAGDWDGVLDRLEQALRQRVDLPGSAPPQSGA
jgi:hypothetical protein